MESSTGRGRTKEETKREREPKGKLQRSQKKTGLLLPIRLPAKGTRRKKRKKAALSGMRIVDRGKGRVGPISYFMLTESLRLEGRT